MSEDARNLAVVKVRLAIEETAKILRASRLTASCYHKIRRLHDDKIGAKGIAQEVGCSIKEVEASLWRPTSASAYVLFKASEICSSKVAAAGLPFSDRSKFTGTLWAKAKSDGSSCQFEAQAIEEKHVVLEQMDNWNTFISQWLESRHCDPSPAASRDRPKTCPPAVKKVAKQPSAPRPITVVQNRNKELKLSTEDAAARRALWFARHWEYVRPFLPPGAQSLTGDFAKKVLRIKSDDVEAGSNTDQRPVIEPLPMQPQPRSIVGTGLTMYDYQLEGMTWMLNQHRQGVGGILGDEMGLGKTLQVIAFLAALKDGGEDGPYMIVAPLSVLPTWEREFQRWCPSFHVVQFHGNEERRKDLWINYLSSTSNKRCDVVITTYEMLIAATTMLTHRTYSYVILDEAQRIKNEASLIAQAVRKCRSVNKLLITGTPLQNDMHELWALLNFMFPDIFASSEQFDNAFHRHIGGTNVDLDLVCSAHRLLTPLMIRRLKKDVQKNLPKKTVLTIWCPITDMQRFWYRKCLEASGCAKELMIKTEDLDPSASSAGTSGAGGVGGKSKLMNLLMQLRKVVNHPYMFPEGDLNPAETDASIVTVSSKMMVLDRLLSKLKAEGRRVLVYSQFTTMLDIIQDYCNLVDHRFMRLDGSTCLARRKYEIKLFNSKRGDQFVYLLSTRAGALGITLTGADTVIMYDSDWNPTWDRQAHDRVHRIGQDKDVTIYQLLCKDTVEQRIFQRAAQKLSLNELVLRDDTDTKSDKKEDVLSSGEVKKMLRCGVLKILDTKSTLMTEESVDELIAAAHARGDQSTSANSPEQDDLDDDIKGDTLNVFNQKLLEVRNFDGVKFDSARDAIRSIADQWAHELAASGARRERVSTVEKVGGYQVKKINRSSAQSASLALHSKQKHKHVVVHDSSCLYCRHGAHTQRPMLHCMHSGHCHRSFHESCLNTYIKKENAQKKSASQPVLLEKTFGLAGFSCTQHNCSVCMGKASSRGGVMFRCWHCPVAFCSECLPEEFVPLDVRSGEIIDQVKYLSTSVEYLVCAACTNGRLLGAACTNATSTASAARKRRKPEKGAGDTAPRKAPKAQHGKSNFARLDKSEELPMPILCSSRTTQNSIMEQSWHVEGPHTHKRVRRATLNSSGDVVGFVDGTVVGYLPLELADYTSELTGRPAPLWHIRFDDLNAGEEDLEEVEVQDAMDSYAKRRFQSSADAGSSIKFASCDERQKPKHMSGLAEVEQGAWSSRQVEGASISLETPIRPVANSDVHASEV